MTTYGARSGRTVTKSNGRGPLDQAYGVARQMTELREKHRLAQVELAEKTGLPQAQIGRIERGAVRPTSATRAKIAEALGLTFVSSSGLSAVFGGALPAEGRGASRLASDPLISRLSRGRRRAHSFVAVWITG